MSILSVQLTLREMATGTSLGHDGEFSGRASLCGRSRN